MTLLEVFLLLGLLVAAAYAAVLGRALRRQRQQDAQELARVRAEHTTELAAQAERAAGLFDRMVEGIIVVGPDGRIRLANRAAGALFHFSPPATDRTLLEATRHHEVAKLFSRLAAEPEVLNHALRLDRGAETRHLQVNAVALRSASQAPEGALLVFHDVTRVRELEAVRQDFVANVSHELRTPLSLIKSAAETLLDGGKADPAVTQRFLEIIDKHANRLTLLIDDLLLLARLDSGRIELKLGNVSLREAAQEALGDAALIAMSRRVTLNNAVAANAVAYADPERLRQVLANLIDNAIKYGREGGHITVGGSRLDATRVELTVRDDGPGIPTEAKARIFERFYRVDKARSREQGGTGLGLAIVKNVVQAHGGDVRVESSASTGTTFFITLPAAQSGAVEKGGGITAGEEGEKRRDEARGGGRKEKGEGTSRAGR